MHFSENKILCYQKVIFFLDICKRQKDKNMFIFAVTYFPKSFMSMSSLNETKKGPLKLLISTKTLKRIKTERG